MGADRRAARVRFQRTRAARRSAPMYPIREGG